jgi:uncharacterized RDD family membrane protein YckC
MFQQFNTPKYASFGIRLLAYIIDSLLLSAVFFPLGVLLGVMAAMTGTDGAEELSTLASAVINLLSIFAAWLYSAILESSSWQATLGKKIFGIKVTDMSGNRISFGKATGRHFAKFLSSIICAIGFIMAAFTEQKQALHDILASTLVVEGKGGEAGITLDHNPPPPPSDYNPPPSDFGYRG